MADKDVLGAALAKFAESTRSAGVADQQMAEYLLELGARWLNAHGVSAMNIHQWVDLALRKPMPTPLTAAARAPNDFGGARR